MPSHFALFLFAVSLPFLCIRVTSADTLALDKKWDTKMQGGTATMTDLVRLFGEFVQPAVDLAPHPNIEIYRGVTYLMPLKDAVKTLGLGASLPSRNLVVCPGFPRESFYYYKFKGLFDGYNQINLVVDRAEQVATIQLVDETPRGDGYLSSYSEDDSWLTYNYVNYRVKAMKKLKIKNSIEYFAQKPSSPSSWENCSRTNKPLYPFDVLRINTVLFDPSYRGSFEKRTLEAVRWYLPVPLAQLLLHCINNSMNSGA